MSLSPEWELLESKDFPGRVYYYNNITHESTWIRPLPYPGSTTQWPPIINVSHILVKHVDCPDKNVWKQAPITRSKEDARQKIIHITEDISNARRPFEDIAKEESDDNNTYDNGGYIGWIKRGVMPVEFDDVAFKLPVGKLSPPVLTSHGWHLIIRRA